MYCVCVSTDLIKNSAFQEHFCLIEKYLFTTYGYYPPTPPKKSAV